MPLGNDPTPLAELEAGFGVTANAEELVKQNQARYSSEQLAALMKPVNDELTEGEDGLRENMDKLEGHLDHEVVDAVVRGSGINAVISYVYLGSRDAHEKGYVPYVDVFGNSRLRKRRQQARAAQESPEQAAQRAAAETMQDADREAQAAAEEKLAQARADLRQAEADAAETVAEARAEADRIRAAAVEDARKAAEKAAEEARKAAESDQPAKRGDGSRASSGTGSGRKSSGK